MNAPVSGLATNRACAFERAYVGLALGRSGYPWAKAPPEVIVEARR
jgi:hypothetical protein